MNIINIECRQITFPGLGLINWLNKWNVKGEKPTLLQHNPPYLTVNSDFTLLSACTESLWQCNFQPPPHFSPLGDTHLGSFHIHMPAESRWAPLPVCKQRGFAMATVLFSCSRRAVMHGTRRQCAVRHGLRQQRGVRERYTTNIFFPQIRDRWMVKSETSCHSNLNVHAHTDMHVCTCTICCNMATCK